MLVELHHVVPANQQHSKESEVECRILRLVLPLVNERKTRAYHGGDDDEYYCADKRGNMQAGGEC